MISVWPYLTCYYFFNRATENIYDLVWTIILAWDRGFNRMLKTWYSKWREHELIDPSNMSSMLMTKWINGQ